MDQAQLDAGNLLTREHIATVKNIMMSMITELLYRASVHDDSKLVAPEAEVFAEFGPKLRGTTYDVTPGSVYQGFLADMKPALDHHYANNDHHPEFYPNGVNDMSLMALIEMMIDWVAAGRRHKTGSFERSLEMNTKRFGLSPQLVDIMRNTFKALFPDGSLLHYEQPKDLEAD